MNNISQNIEPKDPSLFGLIGMPDNGAKTSVNDPQVLSFGNILNDNLAGSLDTAAKIELQLLSGNTVENDLSIMSGTKPGKTIQDNQSLDSLMANLCVPTIIPDNNILTQDVSTNNNITDSLNPQANTNQDVSNILFKIDGSGTGLPQIALAATEMSAALPILNKMAAGDILLSSDIIDEVTLQSPANGSSPNMTQIGAVGTIDRNDEVISIPQNFGFNTKNSDTVAEGIVDAINNDTTSSQKNGNLTAPNSQVFSPNTAVDNRQPLVAVVYPTTLIKNDKINTGGKERQNLASLISSPAITQSSVSNSFESEPISIIGEKASLKNNALAKAATPAVIDSEIENNDATAIGNNTERNNGLATSSVSDDNNPALEESSVDLTKDTVLGKAGMAKNTVTVLENNLKSDSITAPDTAPVKFVMPAEFNKAALKNGQTVVIKLKPESLGQIRLTLSSGPDSFVGRVVVENSAARTVIESNINQLYDQLARQGIKVDSFSVSMSGGQSGDRFAQSHSTENSRQQARWKKDYKSPAISGMSTSSASRLQTYVSAYGVNCFA
jgi:flagellar hook-length control protein FliK